MRLFARVVGARAGAALAGGAHARAAAGAAGAADRDAPPPGCRRQFRQPPPPPSPRRRRSVARRRRRARGGATGSRRRRPGAGPSPHDKGEVPASSTGSNAGDDVEAAHAALVAITKQDFGPKPKRWASWWKQHEDDERIDWLFEGLSHKTAEIRAAAEQELRALTGEYFGYAFDLPRDAREAARARWQAWWTERRSKPTR